jgi:cysteine sulfinate desulfinase/cysteine desulfurase-like protein
VDIYAHFGVSRSFRRGTTTQALIVGLTEAIIDANNRWRNVERAKEKMQSQMIRDQYVEILKALRKQLKFSEGI